MLHLDDADAFDVVAVALDAFEVRVKFEIIDVVFAVAGGETDHRLARPDSPALANQMGVQIYNTAVVRAGERRIQVITTDEEDIALARSVRS
jgi:hypothetical protein